MRKCYLISCIMIIMVLGGCKTNEKVPEAIEDPEVIEEPEETVKTMTNIDWTDFIKYFDVSYENTGIIIPEEKIEKEIGEITGNPPWKIEGPEYITKNGEAGWLPVGTKLYSIVNLNQQEYIGAYFEGKYIFYKTAHSPDVKFETKEEEKELKKVTKKERLELTKAAGYEDIYDLPKIYTISMAGENGVFLQGSAMNGDKMIDFLTAIGDGKPAMVRKAVITVEGNMVLTDYIFNGKSYKVIYDNSRDEFGGKTGIKEKNYIYAVVKEDDNGKYITLTKVEDQEESEDEMILLDQLETEELDGINLLKISDKEPTDGKKQE